MKNTGMFFSARFNILHLGLGALYLMRPIRFLMRYGV